MSRYDIEARDKEKYSVVVGWDNMLGTFFAIVKNKTETNEEDEIVLWAGASGPRITNVVVLKKLIESWAYLPLEIENKLNVDAD